MKIHLYLGLSNYYNRRVIKYNTLDEYQDHLLITLDEFNFKPEDGINTEVVINTVKTIDHTPFIIESTPDYVIVAEDDRTIVSRWFIMEWTRKAKGQYIAKLRRDVIVDFYDEVINAPVFIEKATITNVQEPALFNSENMGFNQIKRAESYLKDKSKCPWIVGYVPTNFDPTSTNIGGGTENHSIRVTDINGNIYRANNMGPTTRRSLQSAPYAMFFMAYDDAVHYVNSLLNIDITSSKNIAMTLAMGIAAAVGADNVFDIQLLPYCPYQNGLYIIDGVHQLAFNGLNYSMVDQILVNTKLQTETVVSNVSIIFWAKTNQFSFNIPATGSNIDVLMTDALNTPSTALALKVNNETNMFRLCSPNYNGQFEFNPMKNHGVSSFEVDCTYQPFQPYIHVVPKFKTYNANNTNLYGKDYDDARGLICGGDFSLPQERSAWANYQQNNKNYQSIFDRQIQNMEFNNKIAMATQIVSAVTGTGQGAAAGAYLGGPVGAGVGAVASGLGGIADTLLLNMQQKETLDYTKDQFGYNLKNIQAMPNSITKTNPFTNNNKIFPVLEYFTCTEIEKQALKDKLKYNGMTIMRIGKIKDWLLDDYTYIKAKLIEIDIRDEYHTVVEIAQELDKGIRIRTPEEEES